MILLQIICNNNGNDMYKIQTSGNAFDSCHQMVCGLVIDVVCDVLVFLGSFFDLQFLNQKFDGAPLHKYGEIDNKHCGRQKDTYFVSHVSHLMLYKVHAMCMQQTNSPHMGSIMG